jgi:siroheme synthase
MLIERGGTARQRELRGPLDDLVAHCAEWSTNGPTLVMIGAAVGRGIAFNAAALPAHA